MDMETKVKEVLSLALSHLQNLTLQLSKLDINNENIMSKSQEDRDKSYLLNNLLFYINDVIHPMHAMAKDIFPDAKPFIDMLIENQKRAIENKIIPDSCLCTSCKKE